MQKWGAVVRESQVFLDAFTFLVGFSSLTLLILTGNLIFKPLLRFQAFWGDTYSVIRAGEYTGEQDAISFPNGTVFMGGERAGKSGS